MADDLVHVGRQLAGDGAPLLGPRRLLRRPRELAPELGGRRSIVGLVDVRERHRLAAELLANRLVVRQVDADRGDRSGVAGLDDDVDGVGGDAGDAGLAIAGVPRHPILEPLGVGCELADLGGLDRIDVEDERLPRALHPARVHVDFDEAVDGVDRRGLVFDPGDVVGGPIAGLAGAIELDQRRQRPGHRLGGVWQRRLEVRDDVLDLRVVAAADAIDLFDQLAILLYQPRVQGVLLVEALDVLHRHADVEVVGAGREDVLVLARRLAGDDRVDCRVEEERLHAGQHRRQRFARLQRELRAVGLRRRRGGRERGRGALHHELARREVVVGTGVDPEQLRVALDLGQRRRVDAFGVGEDLLEHVTHLEVVFVALVVEDVAPGERRLIEVPDQDLLLHRQLLEAVGVELHHGCVVDALEKVLAAGGRRRGRCRRRSRPGRRRVARRARATATCHCHNYSNQSHGERGTHELLSLVHSSS